ncbi:hypothetical protein, partial [Bacillus sp. WP8]|uniref:hypothetical protein n=1 Tax=Bacillus sp. WP8 TaxID=756828 RepID=UPI001C92D49C
YTVVIKGGCGGNLCLRRGGKRRLEIGIGMRSSGVGMIKKVMVGKEGMRMGKRRRGSGRERWGRERMVK